MFEQFGVYRAWLNPALGEDKRVESAAEVEELGFKTIWAAIGKDPVGCMGPPATETH
jgi:hypothetical protein